MACLCAIQPWVLVYTPRARGVVLLLSPSSTDLPLPGEVSMRWKPVRGQVSEGGEVRGSAEGWTEASHILAWLWFSCSLHLGASS